MGAEVPDASQGTPREATAAQKPGAVKGAGGYVYQPQADGTIKVLHDPTGRANNVTLSSAGPNKAAFKAVQKELGLGEPEPQARDFDPMGRLAKEAAARSASRAQEAARAAQAREEKQDETTLGRLRRAEEASKRSVAGTEGRLAKEAAAKRAARAEEAARAAQAREEKRAYMEGLDMTPAAGAEVGPWRSRAYAQARERATAPTVPTIEPLPDLTDSEAALVISGSEIGSPEVAQAINDMVILAQGNARDAAAYHLGNLIKIATAEESARATPEQEARAAVEAYLDTPESLNPNDPPSLLEAIKGLSPATRASIINQAMEQVGQAVERAVGKEVGKAVGGAAGAAGETVQDLAGGA
jgi:hypothetical protein